MRKLNLFLGVFLVVTVILASSPVILGRLIDDPTDPLSDPTISNISSEKNGNSATVYWTVGFSASSDHNWMEFYWDYSGGGVDYQLMNTWDPTSGGNKEFQMNDLVDGVHGYKIKAYSERFIPADTSEKTMTGSVEIGPPDTPVISDVQIESGIACLDFSWQIDWGWVGSDEAHGWSGSTVSYTVDLYCDTETPLTSEDIIRSWTTSETTFTAKLETGVFTTYSYRIDASVTNAYGGPGPNTASATYGPESVEHRNHPTDDAYIKEFVPTYRDPEGFIKVTNDAADAHYGYLKFNIWNPNAIISATLYACVALNIDCTHSIEARTTKNNWVEETLDWEMAIDQGYNPPDAPHDPPIHDTAAAAGEWNSWDVTDYARTNYVISIFLLSWSSGGGVYYWSKECPNPELRPYLEVTYQDGVQWTPRFYTDPPEPAKPFANLFFDGDTKVFQPFNPGEFNQWTFTRYEYGQERWWPCYTEIDPQYLDGVYYGIDNDGVTDTAWNGYEFIQEGLRFDRGFAFTSAWGLQQYSYSFRVRVYIQLLDANGQMVAKIGYYDEYTLDGTAKFTFDIGSSHKDDWIDRELGVAYHTIELRRNPFTNEINLIRDDISYHTGTLGTTVTKVQFGMFIWRPGNVEYGIGFDYLLSHEIIALDNPNSCAAKFSDPIDNYSFEVGDSSDSSQVDQYWDYPTNWGQRTSNQRLDGLRSWEVPIHPSGFQCYAMEQVIARGEQDNNEALNALEEQRIGFSYWVFPQVDCKAIAEIRYYSTDEAGPVAIRSESLTFTIDDYYIWHHIRVDTYSKLPDHLEYIVVRIEVVGISDPITCYLDRAGLEIRAYSAATYGNYFAGGTEMGNLRTIVSIKEVGISAGIPTVVFVPYIEGDAKPGYEMRATRMQWVVFEPGDAADTLDKHYPQVFYGNNEGYYEALGNPFYIDAFWNGIASSWGYSGGPGCDALGGILELVGLRHATKLIPYAGLVITAIDLGVAVCFCCRQQVSNQLASPGIPGYVHWLFPEDIVPIAVPLTITSFTAGIELEWQGEQNQNGYRFRVTSGIHFVGSNYWDERGGAASLFTDIYIGNL